MIKEHSKSFWHILYLPGYCKHVPVDVVFVLHSESVVAHFLQMARDFIKSTYVQLGIYSEDFRIGLIINSNGAINYITLNDQSHVMRQLGAIPDVTIGSTGPEETLELMMDEFDL